MFSWSYAALTLPAARLFRLLGLHPGPDIGIAAVASLAGCPPAEARRLLAELVRANLLTEPAPDRYAWHDLVHVYAAELAGEVETAPARRVALVRLLDHHTHTAHAADRLLHPHRDPMDPPPPRHARAAVVERFADDGQAMGWLWSEYRSLLAIQRLAVESGLHAYAWHVAWTVDTFLIRRGYRHDLARAWQTALRAACRLDDARTQAHSHRALVVANIELGCHRAAHEHAGHALEHYLDLGDSIGQAHTYRTLAYLCWRLGDPGQALNHGQQALALFRAAGHRTGIAQMLNGVGWYHAELGNHTAALAYCEQALALLDQLGDEIGAAYTWDSLGYAHHHLGHHRRAIECYHQAMALHRRLGDRHDQADTLTRLGDTYHAVGEHDAARDAWQQALTILTEIDHPDTPVLRGKLITAVGAPSAGSPA